MGDVNVNLKCDIDANPRVIALFWVLDQNGTTLAEGEVIDEAWTLVMVRDANTSRETLSEKSITDENTSQ